MDLLLVHCPFLLQARRIAGGRWFPELVLGYKVPWENEKKNRAMIAHRITIKKYLRQSA